MSDNRERLLFHIIYTPGTVAALLPFLDTLLAWSDCAYCLVANGCADDEVTLLRKRCAREPRVSWYRLPWSRRVEHGQALNYLYAESDQPHFCFMDSDILAAGDFMADLHPAWPGAGGLFSAWPITVTASERVLPDDCRFIGGRHSHTTSGMCLGGSYFAIYDRAALSGAMRQAPDGFNRGFWAQLPRATRRSLCDFGQERLFYDTGRVLNLYLQSQGGTLRVHDCAALLHLGSYSIYTRGPARPARPIWRKALTAAGRRLRERLNGQSYRDYVLTQVAQDPTQSRVNQRRALLAGYFAGLTAALAAGKTPPAPPQVPEAEIDAKIERGTQALTMLLGKP